MLKNFLFSNKQACKERLLLTYPPILVAGLGRCGTTLIFDTIVESGYKPGYFINRIEDYEKFQPGFVYKTHDYPPSKLPHDLKVIFMFGDPYNITLSAHNKINEWGRLHFNHICSNFWEDNNIVFKSDVLNLKKQFQHWYNYQNFEFISIRYESLGEISTIDSLNTFLGFKLKSFTFNKRSTDWSKDTRIEILKEIYEDLRNEILAASPCVVWKSINNKE